MGTWRKMSYSVKSKFHWGKYCHTDLTLKEVIDKDKAYVTWCLNNGIFTFKNTATEDYYNKAENSVVYKQPPVRKKKSLAAIQAKKPTRIIRRSELEEKKKQMNEVTAFSITKKEYKEWQIPEMTMNTPFGFGKYKGIPLSQVQKKDPQYIEYIVNNNWIRISAGI